MDAIEYEIESVIASLISRQFAAEEPEITIPVIKESQSVTVDAFQSVIISVEREEEALVIKTNETSTYQYSATISLNRMYNFEGSGKILKIVDDAMNSEDTTGIDLSDFDEFIVFSGKTTETEHDEEGRVIHNIIYKIAATAAQPN